jgi:hypothetical protein|tara:strand:+ start:879 stop:1727 length:849 start_codon:yes stop_codon:yes gene_type:complete
MANTYQQGYSYVSASTSTPAAGEYHLNNNTWTSATSLVLNNVPFLQFDTSGNVVGSSDVDFDSYYGSMGVGSVVFATFSGSSYSWDVTDVTVGTNIVTLAVTNLTGPSGAVTVGARPVSFYVQPSGPPANIANDANNRVTTATGTAGELNAESNLVFDGSTLTVTGTINATTKNFDIPHPTKEEMRLRYSVLEGPEIGVYIRGKITGTNIIELPDYWTELVHEDSITVQLTSINSPCVHYVTSQNISQIEIECGCKEINAYYNIYAERKDVGKLEVEYTKND